MFILPTEFENPIDSDQDLVDRGEKVYLPAGSPLSFFYKTSPLAEQRLLHAEFAENKEDQLYSLIKGQEPKIMLDKLLQGDDETCIDSKMFPNRLIFRRSFSFP